MIQVEHLQHKKWPERESDSMGVFFNKSKQVSVQDKEVQPQDVSIFVKVLVDTHSSSEDRIDGSHSRLVAEVVKSGFPQ